MTLEQISRYNAAQMTLLYWGATHDGIAVALADMPDEKAVLLMESHVREVNRLHSDERAVYVAAHFGKQPA